MINTERGQDGGPPSCGKSTCAGQRLSQHAGQEQRILMETLVRLQLGVYFQRVAFKVRTLGSACLLMTHLGREKERERGRCSAADKSCTLLWIVTHQPAVLELQFIHLRFVLYNLNANSAEFQALSHKFHALFIANVTALNVKVDLFFVFVFLSPKYTFPVLN